MVFAIDFFKGSKNVHLAEAVEWSNCLRLDLHKLVYEGPDVVAEST